MVRPGRGNRVRLHNPHPLAAGQAGEVGRSRSKIRLAYPFGHLDHLHGVETVRLGRTALTAFEGVDLFDDIGGGQAIDVRGP